MHLRDVPIKKHGQNNIRRIRRTGPCAGHTEALCGFGSLHMTYLRRRRAGDRFRLTDCRIPQGAAVLVNCPLIRSAACSPVGCKHSFRKFRIDHDPRPDSVTDPYLQTDRLVGQNVPIGRDDKIICPFARDFRSAQGFVPRQHKDPPAVRIARDVKLRFDPRHAVEYHCFRALKDHQRNRCCRADHRLAERHAEWKEEIRILRNRNALREPDDLAAVRIRHRRDVTADVTPLLQSRVIADKQIPLCSAGLLYEPRRSTQFFCIFGIRRIARLRGKRHPAQILAEILRKRRQQADLAEAVP